jgi:transcriptional antiterminator NusG
MSEVKSEAKAKTEKKAEAIIAIPGRKWYAVRTITGHEKRVKNYLDTEIAELEIGNKISQVLIPEEKVFEVKGGKKKIKYKNFFPGYVLVEAVLDKEVIYLLNHAPSVLKMVGDKNEAIALREDEVNRILGRINDSDEKEKIDMQFEKGDLIKVVNGPFVSFNGTINEINLERMKVKVMVSIFGRKTPIELDFTQIEKEK